MSLHKAYLSFYFTCKRTSKIVALSHIYSSVRSLVYSVCKNDKRSGSEFCNLQKLGQLEEENCSRSDNLCHKW